MPEIFNPKIIRIFLLGIASGFPWVLIGSVLTLWLQEAGVSRTEIGYAGAIFAVYSINFIWSPLLDRIRKPIPFIKGQRKSWILLTQLVMCISCLFVTQLDAATDIRLMVLGCLLLAFASATQDIAIDGYRIDSIPENEHGQIAYASSAAIAGWHTGFNGLGALMLFAVEMFGLSWASLYSLSVVLFAVFSVLVFFFPDAPVANRQELFQRAQSVYLASIGSKHTAYNALNVLLFIAPLFLAVWTLGGGIGIPETLKASAAYLPGALLLGFGLLALALYMLQTNNTAASRQLTIRQSSNLEILLAWLASTIVQPLQEFFRRNGLSAALTLLAFVLLFKIGEAFLGRMSLVFYKEIGFSNEQIATYSKLVSWGVTVLFALVSGWFTARFGIFKGLLIAGISMASSNLMFSLIAYAGPEEWLFAITVVIDGFTSAWSSVAFVAFLSMLCNRSYSASQYALLASLGSLGRTLLASSSGQIVDALQGNWIVFFVLTAFAVIPALLILLKFRHRFD